MLHKPFMKKIERYTDLKNPKGDKLNNFITMVTNLCQIHPFKYENDDLENFICLSYPDIPLS